MQIKLLIASVAALAVAKPLPAPAAEPAPVPEVDGPLIARAQQAVQHPQAVQIQNWQQGAQAFAAAHIGQRANVQQIAQAQQWWANGWNVNWGNGLWDDNLWQWYWLYAQQPQWHGWFNQQQWWNGCGNWGCPNVWQHDWW